MNDDLAALPRLVLREVDARLDAHMRGDEGARMTGEALEWAFTTQRATRWYLWTLQVPEAESWWGKWRGRRMGQNWGSVS